jgi:hypothetical protein
MVVDIGSMTKDKKTKITFKQWFGSSHYVRWILLIIVGAIFLAILYPNLGVPQNRYAVGDVAERDIKAPRDFFIEDKEATERNRKNALESVRTVYDYNAALLPLLNRNVKAAFREIREVITHNGFAQNMNSDPEGSASDQNLSNPMTSVNELIWQKKKTFDEKLGIPVSTGAFSILLKDKFSEDTANLITLILTNILENGVVANKEVLLRESDQGIVIRDLMTKSESIEKNLKHFYGLDQAKTMVRVNGQPILNDIDYTLRNLIVDFCQRLIQPNITLNRSETEERKQQAITNIKPVLYMIKAGEMILREGERVTELQLLKLKTLRSRIKEEQIYVSGIGATILLVSLLMVMYLLNVDRQVLNAGNHNKNLLFIAAVLVTIAIFSDISVSVTDNLPGNLPYSIESSSIAFGVPVASGAMIICLFLGLEIAVAFSLIMAVCAAVIFGNRFELFFYFFLNSTMGVYWIQHCRERKVFVKAGLQIGLLNILLAVAINLFIGNLIDFKLVWDVMFAFLGGIGAGIITAGMAPLIETTFGYATDITLLELSNLEQPILRRLMLEAPGTYHHSVIVGSMVEAAAADIKANPLLAKVCGYYHDIGKIKKPFYFIENQVNSKNLHDKLAPSMSRRILIAHVKEGIEIGKDHKLPQVIIDTIQQHHGTSLIKYFYDKALKLQGEKNVKIEDFRYPGPKPQTREAGLVMLADVVEAASRSLDNPTPARIQGLVQNLINKVFSDGQLDECELTLKDLHMIAKSFNKILNGIHHHRIEYNEKPEQTDGKRKNGKVKNGSLDKQPAKDKKDAAKEDQEGSSGRLKRLGLS